MPALISFSAVDRADGPSPMMAIRCMEVPPWVGRKYPAIDCLVCKSSPLGTDWKLFIRTSRQAQRLFAHNLLHRLGVLPNV